MDKRKTPISERAHEIFDDFKNREHPFSVSYSTGEDTLKVASSLHNLVKRSPIHDKVSVAVRPYVILVGTRQKSQTDKLKDMIRLLANHVDDDLLYDQAMELIGAYGGD